MTDACRDDLMTIVAERAVNRRLVEVARAMDDRDYETLRTIMEPTIVADLGGGELVGIDAVIDRIRHFLDRCGPSQHMLGNVVIDVDIDAGRASSRAYVNDRHVGSGHRSDLTFATLGDYHDEWVLRDERWQMVRRTKRSRAAIGTREVFAGPGQP